uniref:Uncharacterized protein n=1 Tax=Oryza rufipogon TaxID=4529 RepID=A0A0E0QIF3_ORYRU
MLNRAELKISEMYLLVLYVQFAMPMPMPVPQFAMQGFKALYGHMQGFKVLYGCGYKYCATNVCFSIGQV